ncbi:Set1/Ash2 histone methyltransferase complex subunit ASH2, partial [Paragonimus westermani]
DIGKMGPSYDRFRALTSQLRTNITKLVVSTPGVGGQGANETGDTVASVESDGNTDGLGWRKRKSPGSGITSGSHVSGSGSSGGFGPANSNGPNSGYNTELIGSVNGAGPDSNSEFPMRIGGNRVSGSSNLVSNSAIGGSLVRSTRRAGGTAGLCGAAAVSGGPVSGLDEGRAKLNALGFPLDHPFNKEGYRYILVEPDKHASGRTLWDECEHTAGKPIPGLFYRVYLSPQVVMSVNDRANYLKLHESQLMITGDKGYCMARSTHGVHSGTWYFEATITDQPEGSATRIGWSQMLGNLQAPCGYDKFSYSWRSRFGTVFHDSRGRHFAETGYKKDDVVGCMIHLPTTGKPLVSLENNETKAGDTSPHKQSLPVDGFVQSTVDEVSVVSGPSESGNKALFQMARSMANCLTSSRMLVNQLPESYKDRPLIKFRNSYYFEEKDEPSKAEKLLRVLPGSKITFFRNGECMGTAFVNIYAGLYYPAISIYRSATVSVNFGPVFRYPPPAQESAWQPMTDRLVSAAVEQTMADMLYLVEKRGLVERLIKSYSSGS